MGPTELALEEIPVPDVRDVPLGRLGTDPGGIVDALVGRILDEADDPERVRVATFNSCI
ncbi:FXSXX-COOH protein [Actinomadura craniellae]|uniref:FXSXX-COOH protein n=1 Tax=Actinomadura craniellae TaxID=2231787 RepID=A0A365HA33_9ACTN|nr:FxSxx-COOH cyclophane-containing RiPP peptide [Actinomadura craniellae]RAY15955.1 FXSXX-COOH protein [Actinomadura craniellae]